MKQVIAACASALLAAACTTPATETAEVKPDPRQGKEVRQICFNQQIRNWRDNDRKSIIVEKGVHDEYKLELDGHVRAGRRFPQRWAGVTHGGGTCLSCGRQAGDRRAL